MPGKPLAEEWRYPVGRRGLSVSRAIARAPPDAFALDGSGRTVFDPDDAAMPRPPAKSDIVAPRLHRRAALLTSNVRLDDPTQITGAGYSDKTKTILI